MLSNFSIAPPTPKTMITDEITKFLLILKSTFSSTNILSPLEAIIPNSKIDTPPITGDGIVEIRAENLPTKLKISANTAAPPNTNTEKIRVIASTPMFSPYVVLGGPPKSDANIIAVPSAKIERCNPGSFKKFLPTTSDNTIW